MKVKTVLQPWLKLSHSKYIFNMLYLVLVLVLSFPSFALLSFATSLSFLHMNLGTMLSHIIQYLLWETSVRFNQFAESSVTKGIPFKIQFWKQKQIK